MEVFSLLELSLPDTLIWNFLRLAMNGCWVWISSETAHSVSKNISIYPDKLWFSFGSWTDIQLHSYMYNQTAWMALWLGLCTLLSLAVFQFLVWSKLHLLSKASRQVHNSCISLLCISGQSLPLWKLVYQPVAFDSLLTLSKQLTMEYY